MLLKRCVGAKWTGAQQTFGQLRQWNRTQCATVECFGINFDWLLGNNSLKLDFTHYGLTFIWNLFLPSLDRYPKEEENLIFSLSLELCPLLFSFSKDKLSKKKGWVDKFAVSKFCKFCKFCNLSSYKFLVKTMYIANTCIRLSLN